MSKAVLMSIQPYWGFLIIAKGKGWDIEKYGFHEKTVEVRKGKPKDPDWNKTTELYFSKDKKSLARIPEEYRKEVEALCGKVVAKFTCDSILTIDCDSIAPFCKEWDRYVGEETGLSARELLTYSRYICNGWHISELKVYDQPKELSEFYRKCEVKECPKMCYDCFNTPGKIVITRPTQSWQYVEEK